MRPLTKIEQEKLRRMKEQVGEMTPDECLNEALECERIKRELGPLDHAFESFAKRQALFEQYACLLEREKGSGNA